jgi:hypothetical protein
MTPHDEGHGTTFRRMLYRSMQEPAKKHSSIAEYQPVHRRRRFSWERFAWLVCGSFALVETVYQVAVWRLR